MLNKLMTAVSAALVLGSATAAFAYDDPENKIGDRYPFLEQAYRPVTGNALGQRQMTPTNRVLYANQVPENKIGDRYPWLEAPQKVVDVKPRTAHVTIRIVRPVTFAEKALFDRQSARAVY